MIHDCFKNEHIYDSITHQDEHVKFQFLELKII